MDLFREIHLSHTAAEAIARGLYAVAKVDGIHERESGLIASFWLDTGGTTASLADLERGPAIAPSDLAKQLHSGDERHLFVKTALLLAWADGKVTPAESKVVREFATALGVDGATLDKLEGSVKEYLLGHLAHLSNTEATRTVAQKLKL